MNSAENLISKINDQILNPVIGLLFAIAVLYFLWGMIEFIMGANNQDARDAGKRHMIWGIVGLFIMVAVFGIMQIIVNTLS